ncbi:hypothetical protein DPX16_23308 [Anabarilius grahami]|uniref:Uncharacterized protein n=1 Tax=Anabarilius grahami TaxID=495550 RepID=A0A3N0Z8T6_ANAGA|nr:hypothetical protein DPX16_23308 [Anabarilius grahami]
MAAGIAEVTSLKPMDYIQSLLRASCAHYVMTKDYGGPTCPSVVPFEILHSEGLFEVASFEHFGLERPFNTAAMIVFTAKCPSEGDISRLERTAIKLFNKLFKTYSHPISAEILDGINKDVMNLDKLRTESKLSLSSARAGISSGTGDTTSLFTDVKQTKEAL